LNRGFSARQNDGLPMFLTPSVAVHFG
jgi:hypothetical protein